MICPACHQEFPITEIPKSCPFCGAQFKIVADQPPAPAADVPSAPEQIAIVPPAPEAPAQIPVAPAPVVPASAAPPTPDMVPVPVSTAPASPMPVVETAPVVSIPQPEIPAPVEATMPAAEAPTADEPHNAVQSVVYKAAEQPVAPVPAVAPDVSSSIAQNLAQKQHKILLIEDDLFISEMYKRQLESEGYQVSIAMGGFEGVQKLESGKTFDLVLLDLMLPGMSGLDILRKIAEKGQDLPVIIVSNMEDDGVIEEALKIGAKKFLTKSTITPNELSREIEEILLNR